MRRIAFGLAGAAIALAVVASVVSARLPAGGLDAAMAEALRAQSGFRIVAAGPVRFAALPTPHLRLERASIAAGDAPPFLVAATLVATPRLGALVAGRIEIDAVTFHAPAIALDRLARAGLADAAPPDAPARPRPPTLRMTNGVLAWPGGRIDAVEAGLAWPWAGRPLALTGSGRFAGRTIDATLSVADPAALAAGARTAVKTRFDAEGVRLIFDGDRTAAGRLEGAFGVRAASLRDALIWLGGPAPRAGAPLAGFTLSGRATADATGVAVADAEIGLDGGSFVGAARFSRAGGRPKLEATLATERLDLTPYMAALAPLFETGGAWSSAPFDLSALAAFDLDLRLSTDRVRVAPFRLGDAAATVTVADGALDVAIGEAEAYGGALGGRLTLAPDPRGVRARLQVSVTDVDLDDILKDGMARAASVGGVLSADATLDGAGVSAAAIVADLQGQATARLGGGVVKGLDGRAFAAVGLDSRFDVDSAAARFAVAGGVARTEDLTASGEGATLALSGVARLVDRRLQLSGLLQPARGAGLPVRIVGPFSAPRLRPDFSPSGLRRLTPEIPLKAAATP